jgi:cell division protein FtsI (penicillin-binding protein 3)
VQYAVEQALYAGFTNCQAKAGWAIVLDARKGSVLAMATYPTFDPAKGTDPVNYKKNPKTGNLDFIHYNRCISENHEPGSVMKTITACAVINEKMVGPNSLINTDRNDPDYYRLPGDGSHKWEPFMSVKDALVHSSNIIYGKLGYRLGPCKLRRYFEAFGFGRKTGIDLPNEETGILPPWKKWDKASWSRAPIGQYIAVTPIQMAVAYAAVANGGKLMKPYIVDRVESTDGEVLFRNEPVVVGRPITPETAQAVREMMLGVARPGGTARRAAVKGYSIAGKTGTAQMREGKGYSKVNYNASFVGIVPASDPSIVILVTYQKPEHCITYKYHEQTGLPLYNHQGGVCAAPVFKRIATNVSRYLGIEPDKPEELVEE